MAGRVEDVNTAPRIKRFYKEASLKEEGGRFYVCLDDRNARTRAKQPLSTPSTALAEALVDEWNAQEEFIDQGAMPLTGILSAAIDGEDEAADKWRNEILEYLKSDLVCYRAEEPAELAERQRDVWDPYLDYMRQEFGAALVVTSGVVAVPQPEIAVDAVRKSLEAENPETLFALRLATAITGSAALALALWRGDFPPDDIFEASRVDERFQEARWGVDDEAKEREDRMRAEFLAVSRFLTLLAE